MTQSGLARTLRELYELKIERQAILEIEKGKRRVSLDEAFAICAALDIAPLYAFTPWEGEDAALEVGLTVLPPGPARGWVTGEHHSPESAYIEGEMRFYYSNVPPPKRERIDEAWRLAGEHGAKAETRWVRARPALRVAAESAETKEEK